MRSHLAFGLLASLLMSLTAQGEPRPVQWVAPSPETAAILLEILQVAQPRAPHITREQGAFWLEPTPTSCVLNALRPDMSDPLVPRPAQITCHESTVEGMLTTTHWDLSSEIFDRWGTRFYPKGVSLGGSTAELLFNSMSSVFGRRGESGAFYHETQQFVGVADVYEYEDYALAQEAPPALPILNLLQDLDDSGPILTPQESSLLSLRCTREYDYPVGHARPEKPSFYRCDFVYQHAFNGQIE